MTKHAAPLPCWPDTQGGQRHVPPPHPAIKTCNNRIWSAWLILEMVTEQNILYHKQLFSWIKKKTPNQTPIYFATVSYFWIFLSCICSPPCIVKTHECQQLLERTGWGKNEFMLIRPLRYHPAGEKRHTSAIHTPHNHFVTRLTFICVFQAGNLGKRQTQS